MFIFELTIPHICKYFKSFIKKLNFQEFFFTIRGYYFKHCGIYSYTSQCIHNLIPVNFLRAPFTRGSFFVDNFQHPLFPESITASNFATIPK